ncbi:hypothetical protein PO878_20310 [Iamia majanohamensis]|uniref:Uncharacterized protein n=1 Tax=Iamia majanohamensis TaxID=467976 RepID=A0AAE9Y962_9ACTN|nr:hypothetical protein [Iamia majanohamensis]WCO66838.1 hypothetical protein PO878_20310 [Iamia majanohamensis]
MTVALMGLVVTAILGGVLTAIRISGDVDLATRAANGSQAYAEQIKQPVEAMEYKPCATASSGSDPYPALTSSLPGSFTADVIEVEYLAAPIPPASSSTTPSAPTWTSTCTTDQGLQRITVEVSTPEGTAGEVETVVLVKRDSRCNYSGLYQNRDQGPC